MALANPMRLQMVAIVAAGGEQRCGNVLSEVSKSTLTHHWRVLREGGVIRMRPVGRELLVSLRREELDARFPGLLEGILRVLKTENLDGTSDREPEEQPKTAAPAG